MTTQTTYAFGNLQVTQTVFESSTGVTKSNDVERFDGECWEMISQMGADYSKAIILMHNEKNN